MPAANTLVPMPLPGEKPSLVALRFANFKDLAAKFPTQKEFADACGLVPPHVSQMLANKRGIGEGVARRMEKHLGLPYGALDVEGMKPSEWGGVAKRPPANHREYYVETKDREAAIDAEIQDIFVASGLDCFSATPLTTKFGRTIFDFVVCGKHKEMLLDRVALRPTNILDRVLAQNVKARNLIPSKASGDVAYGVIATRWIDPSAKPSEADPHLIATGDKALQSLSAAVSAGELGFLYELDVLKMPESVAPLVEKLHLLLD